MASINSFVASDPYNDDQWWPCDLQPGCLHEGSGVGEMVGAALTVGTKEEDGGGEGTLDGPGEYDG